MKRTVFTLAVLAVLFAIPAAAIDLRFVRSNVLGVSNSNDLDTGDVDGDGDIDVLFTSTFAINDGHGGFTQRPHPPCGTLFRFLDVDTDGDLDVVGINSNALYVLLNDGAGAFAALPIQTVAHYNNFSAEMQIADFSGDGVPDIVTNGGALLVNRGGGLFVDEAPQRGLNVSGGETGNRADVAALDANRDGLMDLFFPFTTSRGYALFIQRPNGTFADESPARFPGVGTLYCYDACDAVDINGDGAMDIATNSQQGLKIFVNDGTGVFAERGRDFFVGRYIPEYYPAAWSLRDLNLDGAPDLVMLGTGGSRIYPSDGAGQFRTDYMSTFAFTSANTSFSSVIHTLDLNNDGWDDILFRTFGHGSAGQVHFYVNQLSATQTAARVALTESMDLALATSYAPPPELGPVTYTWTLIPEGGSVPSYTLDGAFAPLGGAATTSPAGAKVAPGIYQAYLQVWDTQGRTIARAAVSLTVARDYYAEYLECGTERQALTEQLAQSEAARAALQAQLAACDEEKEALLLDAALTEAGLQEIRRLAALPPGQRRSTFQPQGSQAQLLAEVIGLLLNGSH